MRCNGITVLKNKNQLRGTWLLLCSTHRHICWLKTQRECSEAENWGTQCVGSTFDLAWLIYARLPADEYKGRTQTASRKGRVPCFPTTAVLLIAQCSKLNRLDWLMMAIVIVLLNKWLFWLEKNNSTEFYTAWGQSGVVDLELSITISTLSHGGNPLWQGDLV